MSNDTINHLHHVVYNSNFEWKDDLLDILPEWRIGNFSRIAETITIYGNFKVVLLANPMDN